MLKRYRGVYKRYLLWCVCAFWVLNFFGCSTLNKPVVLQEQPSLLNSFQEVQIGRGLAEEIIIKRYAPLNDPQKQLMVNRIGNRIVGVCERRDIMYRFMVLDSPGLGAFSVPGGRIFIFKGLFDRLSESELAAILAHEIGHQVLRHPIRKMRRALGDELLLGLALIGFDKAAKEQLGDLSEIAERIFRLLSQGYTRQEEFMADQLAFRYLTQMGYK
jgi:predicted Zn-dependent protease